MADSGEDDVQRIHVGETADGEPLEFPTVEVLTGRAFITGKSGSQHSILGGTPVHTENGRKPIEDVSEGEQVLSLNKHTYEQEFQPVQAVIEHEADDLLQITLEDGTEIIGTEDHSFLTIDDLEIVPVQGSDVEEGTWFPLARELPSAEDVTDVDLAEYVPETANLTIRDDEIQSGPRTDDRYLDLDLETGKVLGLYLAEGSFDARDTLQISNIDDGVRSFLDGQGFNVYERTCNKGFKPFAKFLQSEFGVGAGGKSLPVWAFDTPAAFRKGVISGYFDGDGTINDESASVMSKSPELLDGMKELLRQFGISTTLRDKLTMYNGEKRQYKRLTVDSFSLATFAEVVDLEMVQKAEQLETATAGIADGGTYNSKDMIPGFGPVLNVAAREQGWTLRDSDNRVSGASVHNLTRQQKAGRQTFNQLVDDLDIEGRTAALGQSDIQWKRVVDVSPVSGTRTVYDLDVALNDNFVANGVFVHNSNSTSVVVEELLEAGYPVLIVDTDGEYYGLKEEYELLHAGADEECDIQVSVEHAEKLAHLALEENVPIILDVSGYLDDEEADELLRETVRHLFAKEKKLKKPFLLVVEECHEYIPEGGGVGETGNLLIKVGKRGRKHGLGVVGISQRPADVKKDFITQANWLVWHRLTWENDTKVVGRIVGSEYADDVVDLGDGEAFIQTDWSDEMVRRVQFKRKRTFDAGATPGLDDFERPDLKSVSGSLMEDLGDITDRKEQEQNRVAELESKLENREQRIAELESELETARDVSAAARKMANALAHGDGSPPDGYQSTLQTKNEHIDQLAERVAELEAKVEDDAGATDDSTSDTAEAATSDDAPDATLDTTVGSDVDDDSRDALVDAVQDRLRRRGERSQLQDGSENESATPDESTASPTETVVDLLQAPPVVTRVNAARRDSKCNDEAAWQVVSELATNPGASAHDLAAAAGIDVEPVHTLLRELRTHDLVARDDRTYAFNVDQMRTLVEHDDPSKPRTELRDQWEP
ncbi:LAGLIDADG family homing endonuclease [Halobacterium noricense]|uniref:LAGLIDADG family homing endonuclease n=1 Tax=Halobacterium noricense TaxID=223182 RepID=UPI003C6DACDD